MQYHNSLGDPNSWFENGSYDPKPKGTKTSKDSVSHQQALDFGNDAPTTEKADKWAQLRNKSNEKSNFEARAEALYCAVRDINIHLDSSVNRSIGAERYGKNHQYICVPLMAVKSGHQHEATPGVRRELQELEKFLEPLKKTH